MQFTLKLMDEADACAIRKWRYDVPYAVYNRDDDSDDFSEELDQSSPYYSVRDEYNELVGFFNFGTSALIWESEKPALFSDNKTIPIGLGLRPDLTGNGLGLSFVKAGLAFAKQQFAADQFRLFVYTFNQRAIRVYERAGFSRERVLTLRNVHGEGEWLEMSCHA